jgi:hypothetical protein
LTAGDLPSALTPTSIELGHATDTTLTRVSAGVVSIEGNNIITSATVPVKATGAEINTGTDDAKFATSKAIADSHLGVLGGWSVLPACSYNAADKILFAPGVFPSGAFTAGAKIKLTNGGSTKYFIVTALGTDGGGNTICTLLGRDSVTVANSAITNPFYSTRKSPALWGDIDSYSTSEVDTGKLWIDGKRIYRKVFTGITGTQNATVDTAHSLSVSTMIACFGNWPSSGTTIPIYQSSTAFITVRANATNISVSVGSGVASGTATVVLEYTKT